MNQVKISDLKIGDRLSDSNDSGYGKYIDNIVSEIRITKGGRYVILYDRTYVNTNGIKNERQFKANYSNGALSPNTIVTIK